MEKKGSTRHFKMQENFTEHPDLTMGRKGGCYVTKIQCLLIALFILIIILASIIITRYYTLHLLQKEDDMNETLNDYKFTQIYNVAHLNGSAIPKHYSLTFEPDVVSGIVNGRASIFLKIDKSQNFIYLHCSDLIIYENSINLSDENMSLVNSTIKVEIDTNESICGFYFDVELLGSYWLNLNYTAPINRNPIGFYLQHDSGITEQNPALISRTSLGNVRKMFPCVEDPFIKTTFKVRILRRKTMTSFFNTPIEINELHANNNLIWDNYNVTPPMKLSSLTIVIADLAVTRISMENNSTKLTIWNRKEFIDQSIRIAGILPKIFEEFLTLYEVEFMLPQLTIVIIPEVISYNGWGLIILDELSLSHSYCESFMGEESQIIKLFSLELSKQWFQHFVSPAHYVDSWLHDSLSIYTQYVIWEKLDPEGYVPHMFLLENDIDHDVNSSIELNFHYLNNEYLKSEKNNYKGVQLLKMLFSTVKDVNVMLSIQEFVRDWRFKTVESEEFWFILQKNIDNTDRLWEVLSETSIKQLTDNWIQNYHITPIINISRNTNSSIIIKMENVNLNKNFLLPVNVLFKNINSSYVDSDYNDINIWISGLNSLEISKNLTNSLILTNPLKKGYYRGFYDDSNLHLLLDVLQNLLTNEINYQNTKNDYPINSLVRTGLLDDVFTLSMKGYYNYSLAFELTKYLASEEKTFGPWAITLKHFQFLELFLWDTPIYNNYKDYLINLMEPMYSTLTTYHWPVSDMSRQNYLKSELIDVMCKLEYEPCQNWAKAFFNNFKDKIETSSTSDGIFHEFKNIIFCTMIKLESNKTWNFLWTRYKSNLNSNGGEPLLCSLACTQNPDGITNVIDETLSNHLTRKEIISTWKALAKNIRMGTKIFQIFQNRWNTIYEKFKNDPEIITTVIRGATTFLTKPIHLSELIIFNTTASNNSALIQPLIQEVIAKTKRNIYWRKERLQEVTEWFQVIN